MTIALSSAAPFDMGCQLPTVCWVDAGIRADLLLGRRGRCIASTGEKPTLTLATKGSEDESVVSCRSTGTIERFSAYISTGADGPLTAVLVGELRRETCAAPTILTSLPKILTNRYHSFSFSVVSGIPLR